MEIDLTFEMLIHLLILRKVSQGVWLGFGFGSSVEEYGTEEDLGGFILHTRAWNHH